MPLLVHHKKANLLIDSRLPITSFSFLEEVFLGNSVNIRESCCVKVKEKKDD